MKLKTIIIAEIGPNHNGSLNLAKKLIKSAKLCGADYVKFQTYKTENIIIKNAKKANYMNKFNIGAFKFYEKHKKFW